jgi:hypothetical protein
MNKSTTLHQRSLPALRRHGISANTVASNLLLGVRRSLQAPVANATRIPINSNFHVSGNVAARPVPPTMHSMHRIMKVENHVN